MQKLIFGTLLISIFFTALEVIARGDGDDDPARFAFKSGLMQFEDELYAKAVESFKKAYRLSPSWKLLYNIGQCEASLKHYGMAIEIFEQYLSEGGDEVPPDRRDGLLSELDRLRRMVGLVMFDGPDGIQVFVDEILRGTTPMASGIQVSAGVLHTFEFKSNGLPLGMREEKIRGGMVVTLKTPGVDGTEDQSGAAAPKVIVAPTRTEPRPAAGKAEKKGISPVFFWVGLGTTVALGTSMIAMNAVVGKKGDAGEDVEGKQITGIVLLSATAVVAATTGVLAIFTNWKGGNKEEESKVALSPWSDGQAAGLSLSGRF